MSEPNLFSRDFWGEVIIQAKKLAKALSIEEVKEEPHHSEPYNSPRGHIGDVIRSERPKPILPISLIPMPKTPEEREAIDRIENPLFHVRRR